LGHLILVLIQHSQDHLTSDMPMVAIVRLAFPVTGMEQVAQVAIQKDIPRSHQMSLLPLELLAQILGAAELLVAAVT
jgi:hypothetical protein